MKLSNIKINIIFFINKYNKRLSFLLNIIYNNIDNINKKNKSKNS